VNFVGLQQASLSTFWLWLVSQCRNISEISKHRCFY